MVLTESHLVLAEHSGRRQQRPQDSAGLVMRKCQAQRVAAVAEADMQAEARAQTQRALHLFTAADQAAAATRSDTPSARAKQA